MELLPSINAVRGRTPYFRLLRHLSSCSLASHPANLPKLFSQGDHSACSKPPVDIDLKVVFYNKDLRLKHNLQINVNERFLNKLNGHPVCFCDLKLSKSLTYPDGVGTNCGIRHAIVLAVISGAQRDSVVSAAPFQRDYLVAAPAAAGADAAADDPVTVTTHNKRAMAL